MQPRPHIKLLLLLLSLVLCAWHVVGDDPMNSKSLDAFVESLPGPLQVIMVIVILPFMLLFGFGFMLGTALLGLLAWLRYGKTASLRVQPLVLPLLSMLWVTVQAAPFLRVHAGESIRPMAWAAYVFMSAAVLAVLSVISTISALKRQGNRALCLLALVLSATVVLLPSLALHAVARIKGFTLAP